MEPELPKCMFRPGCEPLVSQINNSCRMSILSKLEEFLPREYNEAKKDPVFEKIIAIHANGLNYSARMIHSLLCRQLVTDKVHELWFLFANRPLRFSLQEFYAVTGLRYDANNDVDFDVWVDDGGFWSNLLKQDRKISLNMIWKDHILHVNRWTRVDRLRLVFVCIIAGVILARGEKAIIPNQYIKVVMDIEKMHVYPWGVKAFDLLLDSVFKTHDNFFILKDKTKQRPKSYVLDGLSYALQVWGMEAIPLLGKMLGEKLDESQKEAARCANWSGAAKVSYEDIIQLEKTFGTEDILYPYISWTGNGDVIDALEYQQWDNEMNDCRVNQLKRLIRQKIDWTNHIWEWEDSHVPTLDVDGREEEQEAVVDSDDEDEQSSKGEGNCGSTLKKRKTRFPHYGAEKRKLKLLCDRSASTHPPATTQAPNFEELKTFFQQMFQESFAKMEENLEKKFDDKIGKLDNEISEIKYSLKKIVDKIGETSTTSKSPVVDNLQSRQRCVVKNLKEDTNVFENLYDVHLSQTHELSTQEDLQKTLNGLSQDTFVAGFDLTEQCKTQEPVDWWTPMSTMRSGRVASPTTDTLLGEMSKMYFLKDDSSDDDTSDVLTSVPKAEWYKFCDWAAFPKASIIGPSTFDMSLAKRILGPKNWLGNEDMDAVMFVFRENTTLGRWDIDRVAFMSCVFNIHINSAYIRYLADKKGFKIDDFLRAYGNGELPSHGRTNKVWGVDVDRLYVPLFVNQNHWISICINILERKIEVFDCDGKRNRKHVEKYAFLIPRIVKAVQPPTSNLHTSLAAYSIFDVPMKRRLNKSCCDCGVYALKFVECHLLGLDLSLVDDEIIRMCRQKIAFDLWKAANDPVLVERMSKYTPSVFEPPQVVDLE